MRGDGLDLELGCADEDLRALEPTAVLTRRMRIALLVSLTALTVVSLVAASTGLLQFGGAS